MNILVISSILPIPSVVTINDFIFQLYGNYRNLYNEDKIIIVNPIRYDFNLFTILKGNTRWQKLKGKRQWCINDFQVEIFHFFSTWRFRNLHALVTRSIFFLNRKRIRTLFKTFQFDIIHARYIFADGILAYQLSKRYEIPYVISTHDEMFYFENFYSKKMSFRILKQAALVLPVNFSSLMFFKTHGITHAVQATHGFYSSFMKTQRKEPNETVRILTVCKLLKYKNVDKIIQALNTLRNSFDFKYTLIGNGPEKEYIHSMVNSLGLEDLVLFIEQVPHEQIADEMYKHDIFILPSYFETFGRVYFEVMAMGIPVICAKNSGIYGLFKEKEEGLAVNHRSIDEIADALAYLIVNREERLRIGRNGQKLVKNYTWENVAKDLHQKYIAILSNNNSI